MVFPAKIFNQFTNLIAFRNCGKRAYRCFTIITEVYETIFAISDKWLMAWHLIVTSPFSLLFSGI